LVGALNVLDRLITCLRFLHTVDVPTPRSANDGPPPVHQINIRRQILQDRLLRLDLKGFLKNQRTKFGFAPK